GPAGQHLLGRCRAHGDNGVPAGRRDGEGRDPARGRGLVIRRVALRLLTAALAVPAAAAGFAPTDPLAAKQWYLTQIHAFDFWPDAQPTLAPVRVAVVDSGLDLAHPEFAGRVALTKSFVGGDATDRQGHGTFVSGIIAADTGNAEGIAGIALSAQLLVAKVVRSDGTISPVAE